MYLRPADEADRKELVAFRCASTSVRFQVEVEEFAHELLDWRAEEAGREVMVAEDGGEIIGFVAYEPDDGDFYVNAIGVRLGHQGAGLGRAILLTTLVDLGVAAPGGVATWCVHPGNFASIAVSEAIGAEATYPPEDTPYARFEIGLEPGRLHA